MEYVPPYWEHAWDIARPLVLWTVGEHWEWRG